MTDVDEFITEQPPGWQYRLTRQRQVEPKQSELTCFQVLVAILVIGVIVIWLFAAGAG